MTTETQNHAREQAEAQLNHIRELMEWLSHVEGCDGDECESVIPDDLFDAGGPEYHHDADYVREQLTEFALSVEVRGDWHEPGDMDTTDRDQFRILLCTGGPAVHIMGELDEHAEPHHAWMEYQDWGTPWTEYYETGIRDLLVSFAQQFYYGD